MKKLFPHVALAVLLLSSPVGAGERIRVGVIPISSNLPLYCAMEVGALSEELIKVELTNLMSGTNIIEVLAGGSLDVGFSATLSILQAAEQGLDLLIVEPSDLVANDKIPASALTVLKDSGKSCPSPTCPPRFTSARSTRCPSRSPSSPR